MALRGQASEARPSAPPPTHPAVIQLTPLPLQMCRCFYSSSIQDPVDTLGKGRSVQKTSQVAACDTWCTHGPWVPGPGAGKVSCQALHTVLAQATRPWDSAPSRRSDMRYRPTRVPERGLRGQPDKTTAQGQAGAAEEKGDVAPGGGTVGEPGVKVRLTMAVKPNPLGGPITPFLCLACAFSQVRVFQTLRSFFCTVQKGCIGEGDRGQRWTLSPQNEQREPRTVRRTPMARHLRLRLSGGNEPKGLSLSGAQIAIFVPYFEFQKPRGG